VPNINSACFASASEAEDSIAILDYRAVCSTGSLYQKYPFVAQRKKLWQSQAGAGLWTGQETCGYDGSGLMSIKIKDQ